MLSVNAAERLIPRLERHAEWLKRSGRKEVAMEVKAAAWLLKRWVESMPKEEGGRDA